MSNLPDQLQDGALCTLDDVCRWAPGYSAGDDTETDDTLNRLILDESQDFIEFTRREIIARNDDTVRTFDVDWITVEDRELFIGDAATVTDVTLKTYEGIVLQTLTSTSWIEDPRPSEREVWEPITSLKFPKILTSPAQLAHETVAEVTGTWGFPAIPRTVARSVSTFVVIRYVSDAAAAGTRFGEAANRDEIALTRALAAALDVRSRLQIKTLG